VIRLAVQRLLSTIVARVSTNFQGLTGADYQAPQATPLRTISKSLRCYKIETLCKPLFFWKFYVE
jgi:hypothetical protein